MNRKKTKKIISGTEECLFYQMGKPQLNKWPTLPISPNGQFRGLDGTHSCRDCRVSATSIKHVRQSYITCDIEDLLHLRI